MPEAHPPASTTKPTLHLPRWMRMVLMAALFFVFFGGSPIIAVTVFPALRLLSRGRDDYRRRCTRLLNRGVGRIAQVGRFLKIADYDATPLPASVDRTKPYVLICNHPSFIDMILVLGAFEELTCVTKGSWSRHWALGRLLRSTQFLPGPGSGLPESEEMLDSMVAHLTKGHPLLIFPEGQRSMTHQLRRFRRGAVEAATRANVPIVPMFLALDPPWLTKDVPLSRPPRITPRYTFEWFDVIQPDAFARDGKRIQEHLVALYEKRFEEQHARHEAFRASSAAA